MAKVTPTRSIFFYPHRPLSTQIIENLRIFAGWDLAESPENADWCVLHQDATWITLPDDDPWAEASVTWINGRCRDISKRTVERVFAEVFDYPLAIDPLTYQGTCLRKSDKNYVKDAITLTCPIPADEVEDRYVYERLIDSRIPGLGPYELRTDVVGYEVTSITKKTRPDWISQGRVSTARLDEAFVHPRSVYSHQELEQISAFCRAMHLDFGSLDVIRDNEDKRIYIIDANKTPGLDADRPWESLLLEAVARAFCTRFPPRSAVHPASPSVAETAALAGQYWIDDRHDWWRSSIATRVEAQSERISRLETEVSQVGARLEKLTTVLSEAPWPAHKIKSNKKKKRKK